MSKLLIFIGVIMLIVVGYFAINNTSLPTLDEYCTADLKSFKDSDGIKHVTCLGDWASKITSYNPFTTVNGYLCNDYPDDRGVTNYAYPFSYTCPSWLKGGCAFQRYRYVTDASTYVETLLNPGQTWSTLEYNVIYERVQGWDSYYCNTAQCTCTDWIINSCGSGPCGSTEKYQYRTCSGSCAGIDTQLCIERVECQTQPDVYTRACVNKDVVIYKNGIVDSTIDCANECLNGYCVDCLNGQSTTPVCSDKVVTWKYCINNVWATKSYNCDGYCGPSSCSSNDPQSCCTLGEYLGDVEILIKYGGTV